MRLWGIHFLLRLPSECRATDFAAIDRER